ncbi:MAG TPA: hypothetical protein PKK80_04065 [Bacilli bacterium]|nr:hypothetical protein [Bacilli bacterium]
MIQKDRIERDIDEMTMAQIKVYIEDLKQTIYHMAETMETINSTYKMVQNDLNEFSGINGNKNSNIVKRVKGFTSAVKNSPPTDLDEAFSNATDEDIDPDNPDEDDEVEFGNNYPDYVTHPNNTNNDTDDDITNNQYIALFKYTVLADADTAIISPDGRYYTVFSVEPDSFAEIESFTEYLPYYYFDHVPSVSELKEIWKQFCDEFDTTENSDGFELKTVELIDTDKNKRVIM